MNLVEKIIDRLLTIKSIVTILLTVVFCILCIRGTVSQEFMTVYTVVIAFYFAHQANKAKGSDANADLH